jgi:hypothetical protein
MLVNGVKKYNLDGYDLAEDQIIIIDHMFPPWFQAHVHHQVFDTYSWFHGHTSTYPEDPNYNIGADPDWPEVPALKQQIFPPNSPNADDSCWQMMWNAVTGLLSFELELTEILVNGQQYIHDTVPHTDCDCDNGLTWIYYPMREWKDEWGGPTVVELEKGKWTPIIPKPGRLAIFKGNLPHHGRAPNESYKGLRATVVYKAMRKVPLPPRS